MKARIATLEDTKWITARARSLGFDLCGVVRADSFPELERMQEWLDRGYGGEMRYLENPKRRDPRRVAANIRGAIVCAVNYNTQFAYSTEAARKSARDKLHPRGWISRFAWGSDYHEELWRMLNRLVGELRDRFGEAIGAYACADTGPIHERILAKYAGLGWIGKNTLLLNQQLGSWLFLGVVLTSLDLQPSLSVSDSPPADLCGSCRRCLDACPTNALVEPYVLDARRCISYLTIELRGPIPEEFREPTGWHVFGCDVCQDVCPWNRKAPVTSNAAFLPRAATGSHEQEDSLFMPSLAWLAGLTREEFQQRFRGSAAKRTKWRGLVRNACVSLGNALLPTKPEASERIVNLLTRLSADDDDIIAESARWALSRIQQKGEKLNSGQ
ncbi:MAG TPA: tRNA epoxyqueuosine(34) reductase QueG [Terriglobales bacterium]|nr:tRNA epoxyqueuosine(34) reductase QueG [Terriglobales bacterium]